MIAPRRFLPSISSLLALEAVERLGTTLAAADELSLTHSAVSRQLRVLEDQIGVHMFHREGRGLRLTPAGQQYAHSVRQTLNDLASASLHLRASGSRAKISLGVLPAFAMYWLTPRLGGFMDLYPDVLVNQSTRLTQFDFQREKFDAAIHYGRPDWPGVDHVEICADRVIPACAPALHPGGRPSVQDILSLPLLHLESRPGGWEQWAQRQGVEASRLRGPLYDQFATLARAAAAGLGAALLPDFVAEHEFATGGLVPLWDAPTPTDGSYYIVWPTSRPRTEALTHLCDWLSSAARD
ncbi:MAG: LysR substrate-binding domain-containing protein [Pseudomonadota bacterium]|nr:LysR substrate-binding domain-containing protein [Pseudomonadota bacterium]